MDWNVFSPCLLVTHFQTNSRLVHYGGPKFPYSELLNPNSFAWAKWNTSTFGPFFHSNDLLLKPCTRASMTVNCDECNLSLTLLAMGESENVICKQMN